MASQAVHRLLELILINVMKAFASTCLTPAIDRMLFVGVLWTMQKEPAEMDCVCSHQNTLGRHT